MYFETVVVLLLLVILLLLGSLLGLDGMPASLAATQESTHINDVVLLLLTIVSITLVVLGACHLHKAARKTKKNKHEKEVMTYD